MRDNRWLEERMYSLWENNFDDVPRKNLVLIKFGKASRRQLGSIKWVSKRTKVKSILSKRIEDIKNQDDDRVTLITITKYFADESIPPEVVDATIAHEMVHYAHGFHSPLEQVFKHPHQGNVVEKELFARGLKETHTFADSWLKKNWVKHVISFK
jgi:hypothetical protein